MSSDGKQEMVVGHYSHEILPGVPERPIDLFTNPNQAIIRRLDKIIDLLEKLLSKEKTL